MSCVHNLVKENMRLRRENEKNGVMNDVYFWATMTLTDLYKQSKDNAECAEILRHFSGPFDEFVEKYKDTNYGRTLKRSWDNAKETHKRLSND